MKSMTYKPALAPEQSHFTSIKIYFTVHDASSPGCRAPARYPLTNGADWHSVDRASTINVGKMHEIA